MCIIKKYRQIDIFKSINPIESCRQLTILSKELTSISIFK